MKKLVCLAFVGLFAVCQANAGIIATDTSEPLLVTDMPTKEITDLKCGEGRIVHIFGLVDSGYASIQEIAKFNDIHRIHHVDVHKTLILGCGVTKYRVWGE